MPEAQEKNLSEDLTSRIGSLPDDRSLAELLVKRIQSDIEIHLADDAADAYGLSGLLATYLRDEKSMHSFYKKALKIEPENAVLNHNYSTNSFAFGLIDNAIQYAKKTHGILKDDRDAVEFLFQAMFFTLRVKEASELSEQIIKHNIEKYLPTLNFAQDIQNMFSRSDISADEAQDFLKIAYDLMRAKKLTATARRLHPCGNNSISYKIQLGVDVEQVVDMNILLAEKFASHENASKISTILNVAYSI